MFPAATYINRRNTLKQQVKSGLILFLGNDESPMNYTDNTYRFRQDSSFLYFYGLDTPALAAVIDIDAGSETIFGNELTIDDIVWMGAQKTLSEKSAAIGVATTQPLGQLAVMLAQAQENNRQIHFLPPYRPENKIKLHQWLHIPLLQLHESASVALIQAVIAQRNYKSAEEIAEIEKAADTTVDMHVAAMKMARPGMIECELAAEVQRVAMAAGGDISYPIILTINGQTLHNHHYGNALKQGDMVLCDFGAETAMHYCADLSSTFPVDTAFTSRQRDIYAITLQSYNSAISMLRPGVPFRNVHLEACTTIVMGLKDLGLMKGNCNSAVEAGAHAMFFPCGTGHMMGLDVHDMEDIGEIYVGYDGQPKSTQFGLKSLRLARKLEPGFVLTIEPGIYFIPELIDKWRAENKFSEFINYDRLETYRNFSGIRNEENFLITADGHRRLGKAKPVTIAEIEALRR